MITTSLGRTVSCVALSLAMLGAAPGCDMKDKADVKAVFVAFARACDDADGKGAVSYLAQPSIDYYDRLVSLARTGKREDIMARPIAERLEVLIIRHRMDPKTLAKMDGRAYLEHIIGEGWWSDPEAGDPGLGEIDINGDMASALILDEEGEETKFFWDFYRENGSWKLDWGRIDQLIGFEIAEAATAESMTDEQYIIWMEEEETGDKVRKDIWDKPTR